MPRRSVFAPMWALACWLLLSSADAFPGVLVDGKGEERHVSTTHMVILRGAGVSVVTVMIDYEGPKSDFALLLPVPSDVDVRKVRTLRREILSRVEQLSAPRLHEFYEKDPCDPGPAEQAWEERVRPRTRGFLTPPMLPPPDASYRVSNEMSVPSQPVFKGEENEFSHSLISAESERMLGSELRRRGFGISDTAAKALAPHVGRGSKMLLSRVKLDRVELLGSHAIQLGGIRYTTRTETPFIDATLGLQHSPGSQELFVYVLDPEARFAVTNYPNVLSPTNVFVLNEERFSLGVAYNALFDQVVKPRASFVTEYVWPTDGCGEPCPNAPLSLRELLSLGGDELEARRPKSAATPQKARDEQDADQRALSERRALIARQRYVLSRLHYRYTPSELPTRIELGPASGHVKGGIGIPEGPSAKLSTQSTPSRTSSFQTRFFASHAWSGSSDCKQPKRWRWGKRWKSMGRVSRQVPLALDLPRLPRDKKALRQALLRPVAGLSPEAKQSPPPKPSARPSESPPSDDASSGCSLGSAGGDQQAPGVAWLSVLVLVGVSRVQRRRSRLRSGGRSTARSSPVSGRALRRD